jgi:hypothetical protein
MNAQEATVPVKHKTTVLGWQCTLWEEGESTNVVITAVTVLSGMRAQRPRLNAKIF